MTVPMASSRVDLARQPAKHLLLQLVGWRCGLTWVVWQSACGKYRIPHGSRARHWQAGLPANQKKWRFDAFCFSFITTSPVDRLYERSGWAKKLPNFALAWRVGDQGADDGRRKGWWYSPARLAISDGEVLEVLHDGSGIKTASMRDDVTVNSADGNSGAPGKTKLRV